jgi:hypothetical protein
VPVPIAPVTLVAASFLLAQADDALGLPPWAQGSIALAFLALVLSGKVVVLVGPYRREVARSDKWEALFVDTFTPTLQANTAALDRAMMVMETQAGELTRERTRREAIEQVLHQQAQRP